MQSYLTTSYTVSKSSYEYPHILFVVIVHLIHDVASEGTMDDDIRLAQMYNDPSKRPNLKTPKIFSTVSL